LRTILGTTLLLRASSSTENARTAASSPEI
jgi:hypothetical protein